MSEQGNNLCEICGGWKRIAYTIEFQECVPHMISVDPGQPMAPFKLCPGHPEPAQKHDGKLDEYVGAQVWMKDGMVYICELETIELFPDQALSLLVWLQQEKAELERLAKE